MNVKALIISGLLGVVLIGCAKKEEEPIKIGAILSLSGSSAAVGEEVRDGMLLACSRINSFGGINGRELRLIIEDSKTDREEAKAVFEKIEAEHHPLGYLSVLSSVGIALAPLAEESKVVLVGLVNTDPVFTEQKREYVFRFFSTAKDAVPPIISVFERLKVKDLGMIYLSDDYGESYFKLAKEEFEKTGGTITGQPYDGEAAVFKEQIERLQDKEAIYFVVRTGHIKGLLEQLRQADYKGFLAGPGNVSQPSIRSLKEADGVYDAASIIYNPNFPYAKEVREEYEQKYNKPFSHYGANGYDIVKLLAGLLEDKEISRESLCNLIKEGFVYPGVFGEISLKPGENEIPLPLHAARIVEGEIEYIYR